VTLVAEPSFESAEIAETLEFGCSALLGVCVGANELVGGTTAGKELHMLFDEYKKLSGKSAAL
jgi:hypothetical protein